MDGNYRLIQKDGYLRIVVSPSITVAEFLEVYREVAKADGVSHQPRLYLLPERIEGFEREDLQEIAALGESLHVAGPAAIVAPSDFVYGIARQVTLIRPDDPDRFGVFRSEAEALAWLGLTSGGRRDGE